MAHVPHADVIIDVLIVGAAYWLGRQHGRRRLEFDQHNAEINRRFPGGVPSGPPRRGPPPNTDN